MTCGGILTVAAGLAAQVAAAGAAPDAGNAYVSLRLQKALPKEQDLHVYLATRDGRIAGALGKAPTFSKAPCRVDASGLVLAGGALRGEIAVTLPSDGYSPPPGNDVRAVYRIAARIDGAKLSGEYTGRYDVAADASGGAARKGAVSGTLAAPPALHGPVALRLDMVNAAEDKPIDKKVWGRRGLLYLTYKAGKCIQAVVHGHGDARQVNYFEAVVTGSDLAFAGGKLTGTAAVRSTRGEAYVFTFDGVLVGTEVGGSFTKTVNGKAAPGGVFVGSFEPVADVPADHAVYNVELLGAVAGGRQLNCFIPRVGGTFRAGMAYSGAWNHTYHDVDPAGLRLQGGALSGELKVTMNPDPYVPPDHKPIPAAYALDARVHDGCITGTFAGTFGQEKVSGAVVGRPAALPAVPEPVRYAIKLDDGVNEGAPWLRRVYLSFVAAGGKAEAGGMSNNKGGWQGTFKRAEVRFDGVTFAATIEGSVDSSPSVRTGLYTFKLSGRAVGNELIGKVETWRDGRKTKEGTAFMGSFGPAE